MNMSENDKNVPLIVCDFHMKIAKKYPYTPVEDNWISRTFSLMPHGFPFQIISLHLDFPVYILATDLDFQYKLSMA